jgi:O-antigen ligase
MRSINTNKYPRISTNQTFSTALLFASRISFATTIVLIPIGYRWIILSRPMQPLYSDYTNFLLFAVDVSMITTLILWMFSIAITRHKLTLGPRHIWIPLAGLTLAGWISVISSFDPQLSFYHAIRLVLLFWFYLFIINEIHSVVWVLIPVGLQVVIQAIVALGQSLAQHSLGLQDLGEHLLDPALPGISIVNADGIRLLRAYGLSDHPNILGGSLAFGMLLLLSAYLYAPKPIPFLGALIPGLPALLMTFSRSAWLAFLTAAIFIIGFKIKLHQWPTLKRVPGLILISLFLLAPPLIAYSRFIGTRFDADNSFNSPSVEQQSIGERLLLINSTIPIFIKHPLFGVGLGASPLALESAYPNFPVDYQPPHVTFFDAALETGLLGAVFYITLILSPFVFFFRQRGSLLISPLVLTAFALLVSITIVGFFDYYTWLLVPGRMWQWLAWSLWAVAYKQIQGSTQITSRVTA